MTQAKDKPLSQLAALVCFGDEGVKNLNNNLCPSCGGDCSTFRNELSRKEHQISGLCQLCQDSVFGED